MDRQIVRLIEKERKEVMRLNEWTNYDREKVKKESMKETEETKIKNELGQKLSKRKMERNEIYIKLVTSVEGDSTALFSFATTLRCKEGHYFPWMLH